MIITQLSHIGDISSRYGISSRTLRYYEEIGLLASVRETNYSKRYYSPEMLLRLELILLLKKHQFSVKDISIVLSSDDLQTVVEVFSNKLSEINRNMTDMIMVKNRVENMLFFLQTRGYSKNSIIEQLLNNSELDTPIILDKGQVKDPMEDDFKGNQEPSRLQDHEVRFIELKPMKVAYYHSTSSLSQPEDDAWQVLYAWVKAQGLEQLSTTRYFGFDSLGQNREHGYEMWATVSDDVEPSGKIGIKQVSGGLYAVSSMLGYDIPVAWQRLNEWTHKSQYNSGPHQCLEEHFLFDGEMFVNETFQLDLYHPIST